MKLDIDVHLVAHYVRVACGSEFLFGHNYRRMTSESQKSYHPLLSDRHSWESCDSCIVSKCRRLVSFLYTLKIHFCFYEESLKATDYRHELSEGLIQIATILHPHGLKISQYNATYQPLALTTLSTS